MVDFRYKKLGYVALNVTDLARAAGFHLDTVGLTLTPGAAVNGAEPLMLRTPGAYCDLAIYSHSEPGLRRIAFEMETERDLDKARTQLGRIGLRTWEVPDSERKLFKQRSGTRFVEPYSSLTIELYTGDEVQVARGGNQNEQCHVNLTRLGHVVISLVEAKSVVKFFTEDMNFRISDRIEDNIVFLRCFPNPLHHSLGIGPGKENRLHHVNFMADHLDDLGRALNLLKTKDIPIVFGPGRHPPSGSVFLYFLDPDGLTFEFSSGMEEFPEHSPREPRTMAPTMASSDYWGGTVDPRLGAKGRFFSADRPL